MALMAAHRHFQADNGNGVQIQQNSNNCKQNGDKNGDLLVNTDCGFDLIFGVRFRLTEKVNRFPCCQLLLYPKPSRELGN